MSQLQDVQPVAWIKKDRSSIEVSIMSSEYMVNLGFEPLYTHPPTADVQELVEALQRIVNAVPAGDGCGGFFIEHCDQDGNYIGTESVNPFDVALTLHSIAQAALSKWEGK